MRYPKAPAARLAGRAPLYRWLAPLALVSPALLSLAGCGGEETAVRGTSERGTQTSPDPVTRTQVDPDPGAAGDTDKANGADALRKDAAESRPGRPADGRKRVSPEEIREA